MEKAFYKSLAHLEFLRNHNMEHHKDTKFDYIYSPDILAETAEVYEDAFKREMRKKTKLDLEDQALHENAPHLQKIYNDNKERKKKRKPWMLVTINCKDGEWMKVFKELFHIKSWIWLKKALITVEQRGETEATSGHLPHFHLLLQDYENEKGKIQRRFFDKFKNSVGNIQHIYVNVVKHEWKQDKIDYLMGKKLDNDKLEKQKIDIFWRKNNGIDPWYSLDSLPTSESKPRGGVRIGAGRPKKLKISPLLLSSKKTEIVF